MFFSSSFPMFGIWYERMSKLIDILAVSKGTKDVPRYPMFASKRVCNPARSRSRTAPRLIWSLIQVDQWSVPYHEDHTPYVSRKLPRTALFPQQLPSVRASTPTSAPTPAQGKAPSLGVTGATVLTVTTPWHSLLGAHVPGAEYCFVYLYSLVYFMLFTLLFTFLLLLFY